MAKATILFTNGATIDIDGIKSIKPIGGKIQTINDCDNWELQETHYTFVGEKQNVYLHSKNVICVTVEK